MSSLSPCTVRPFAEADQREAIAVLARAFSIDPLFDFFSRDLLHEHRLLPKMFTAYLHELRADGRSWIAEVADRPLGYAGWLPPAAFPRSARQELAAALRALPVVLRARHALGAARLLAETQRRHPRGEHWYLQLLAVDPTLQGRGCGAALIQPGLDAADADGLFSYLETQKEANLAWYNRFGFAVTDTIELPGLPPVWCMTRPAR